MWLDRLSGQSTPSASPPPGLSRAFSPAPHRSSHLAPGPAARPTYGPRTSSLGLSSKANISTTSLNSPRLPNGSSLRQQISPPADVTDPLDALETLLGTKSARVVNGVEDWDVTSSVQKPQHLAEDIDFDGLSLHAFADRGGQGETKKPLHFSTQTVEECEYVCPALQTHLACR